MTQCAMMAAPASPSITELAESLILGDDPSVAALIAEVDAIFCADVAPESQRPTPPVAGCALSGPRCAGWSCRKQVPPRHPEPVRRVDAMQRSPPVAPRRRTLRPVSGTSTTFEREVLA
jgi:hypothetical protein